MAFASCPTAGQLAASPSVRRTMHSPAGMRMMGGPSMRRVCANMNQRWRHCGFNPRGSWGGVDWDEASDAWRKSGGGRGWRSGAWAAADPADAGRQWARIFKEMEKSFGANPYAGSYTDEMMQRWSKFMEEFAREYGARGGQGAPSPAESKTSNERTVVLPVDMEEEGGAYFLLADVPGLEKSALSIKASPSERTITLSGERSRSTQNPSNDAEADERTEAPQDTSAAGPKMRERRMGRFERVLHLPEDADFDDVAARVERGVLSVRIGRIRKPEPDIREVEVM